MTHQIPHPPFAHNVYKCLQMSQDACIHLHSQMTLQQLSIYIERVREKERVTTFL